MFCSEADAASWPDVQLKFKLVKYSLILLIMDFQGQTNYLLSLNCKVGRIYLKGQKIFFSDDL